MGGHSAPKAYTPANQPAADAGFFSSLNTASGQTAGTAAMANPGYDAAYSGVVNNPYDASMLSGINTAANSAMGVGASDIAQGNQMIGQANIGYGNAASVDALAGLPALDAATLRSYAPLLTEYGFDPQMSNYNFGLQGTKDSQNVANAESGVAGSPFAAGATGDAMAAYTRNYQAAMASKAMMAMQALSQLYGQAGSLDTTSGSLYGQATDIAGRAANIGSLGSDLQHSGVNVEADASQMPYAASNKIQSDRLAALDAAVQGKLGIAGSEQNNAQGYNSYLQAGQGATSLNQKAAQMDYQNSFLGQLGQLAGIAVQVGAHFIPGYGG